MNTKLLLIIAAIFVIAGSAAAYFLTRSDDGSQASTDDQSQTDTIAGSDEEPVSLKQLLASNKSLQCQYSYSDGDSNSSGVVYIDNSRARGQATSQSGETTATTYNFIQDGDYNYAWQEGATEGFKIAMSDIDEVEPSAETTPAEPVDQDALYSYDCQDWGVDDAVFTPPADVTFTDYSAQLNAAQNATDMTAEVCAQITDADARAACEAAL
jgi:hypothetical protein